MPSVAGAWCLCYGCSRLPRLVLLEPPGLGVKEGPDLYMPVSGSLVGGVAFLRGCVGGWRGLIRPKR